MTDPGTSDHGIPDEIVAKIWHGWTPDIRPTPTELLPDFEATRHPKPATVFPSWVEQLEGATFETLRQLANGGAGDPA